MHSLPIFLLMRGRPVILVGGGAAADAKRRLLERAGARIVGEEDRTAAIAIVVEDEPTVARLRARGVLVNAVDRPDLCDFTLPAIVDRDPVIVAVGTGGASAGLAKALRHRLELLLPGKLGRLASALSAARERLRQRWPDAADRRRAIDAGLAAGGPIDLLVEESAGAIGAWLEAALPLPTGGLATIRLRSHDPDDLSLREARLLAGADRVYAPGGAPAAILARVRADAELITTPPPATCAPGTSILLLG